MPKTIFRSNGYVSDAELESPRTRQRWVAIIAMIGTVICCFPPGVCGQSDDLLRIGFTRQMFIGINENDVLAVAHVWATVLFQEGKIGYVSRPIVFDNLSEISAALSAGNIDVIGITTGEFAHVRKLIDEDAILCSVTSGSIMEEYLLLVNRKSNIKKLSGLKGRALGMLTSIRALPAETWLDTLLLQEGMEPAAGFFGQIDTDSKAGNLLIPLFFGKLDACVVTRKAFDTMVELNPQTGKQLEILEISPPVVPTILCFRKDFTSPIRNQVEDRLLSWQHSPAGRQSLAIFQVDSIEKHSDSCLDSALELLSERQRLLDENSTVFSENQQGSSPEEGGS